MACRDDAPQFFVSGLQGIAFEGPNAILTFNAPILSADHKTREYVTNVRLVLSVESLKQSIGFIEQFLQRPAGHQQVMPGSDTKQ